MKKKFLFAIAGVAVLAASTVSTLSAGELLLNGSFESNAQTTDGDHVHVQPDSWTVAANPYTDTSVAGDCNIVRGTVTGSRSATVSISPYDGAQAFDGDGGDYYVSQSITLMTASALHIQLAIGGRDGNSADPKASGSYYQLGTVGMTGGKPSSFNALLTSATVRPATGSFIFLSQDTQVFAAGTYRFTVFLGDPDHLDAVSITPVPEPSALAAMGVGAGLLGWVCVLRRRRA